MEQATVENPSHDIGPPALLTGAGLSVFVGHADVFSGKRRGIAT